MSLQIRALKLHVSTEKGPVGATIPFHDGLCILRADNTSGKSTCMQAIVYALGLEGMLSASHEVPLPHAMTTRVEIDGEERKVLESEVMLEISNDAGKIWTIARTVKGAKDKHLIRTWDGAAITNNGALRQRDFFVRQPGAAVRELGFHRELASFLGWTLPTVGKYDGTLCPLYLECIFPMMLIEQKRGWTAVQARMPLHYRIREVGKRAMEFILQLDAHNIAMKRQRLHEVDSSIRGRWASLSKEVQALAASIGGSLQGIPSEPTSTWPPVVDVQFSIHADGTWKSARQHLADQSEKLKLLNESPTGSVGDQAPELEAALAVEEQRVGDLDVVLREIFEEVRRGDAQCASISRKLEDLEEDLRRNQDVAKLQRLGSTVDLSVFKSRCPTCHQEISDVLLPQEGLIRPMAIEDNVDFIRQQILAYRAMLSAAMMELEDSNRRLATLRTDAIGARRRVRHLKSSLLASERTPSEFQIQERLQLRGQQERESVVVSQVEMLLTRFADLSSEWRSNSAGLAALPPDDLSTADHQKLSWLETLIQQQAADYGLSSVEPRSLVVSRDLYRPVHEGFELEFDLSASDMIRTIWAYVLGTLEMGRRFPTNHAKLLVLDEPRQQDTARVSFGAFLRRASLAVRYGEQVIFATSEELDTLTPLLKGIPHTLHSVQGKVLKALPERS